MSSLQRYTNACIAAAARRWPADLADDMARTWHAELAVVRSDTHTPFLRRTWRQLAFATSLTLSRPPAAADSAQPSLHPVVSGLGRSAATLAGAVGVAMLADMLPQLLRGFWSNLDQHLPDSVYPFTAPITIVAAIAVMWLLGRALGQRAATAPGSTVIPVAARTVALGAALTMVLANDRGVLFGRDGFFADHRWATIRVVLLTAGVWTMLTAIVLTGAIRLTRSGRRRTAWWAALGGCLLALEVTTAISGLHAAAVAHINAATAPAWFPIALLGPDNLSFGPVFADVAGMAGVQIADAGPIHGSAILLSDIMQPSQTIALAAVFALAYAMRATGLATVPRRQASTSDAAPLATRMRAIALAVAIIALGVSAWTAATTIPLPPLHDGAVIVLASQALMVEAGLRAAALVTLAFIIFAAGRGPVAAPAAGLFILLFTTQCVVARSGWHGMLAVTVAFTIGLALLAGGCWLNGALASPATTAVTTRRALLFVTVGAALAAPTSLGAGPLLPGLFNPAQYVVAALCWLLAVTAALGSRTSRLSPIATGGVVLVPLIVLLTFVDGTVSRALYWPWPDFFIQAPLAVVAIAAARWAAPAAPVRAAGRWLLAGMAAVVLSLNVGHSMLYASGPLGQLIQSAYGPSAEDVGYRDLVGQLLVALALALAAAQWGAPPETSRMPSEGVEPSPQPSGDIAVPV